MPVTHTAMTRFAWLALALAAAAAAAPLLAQDDGDDAGDGAAADPPAAASLTATPAAAVASTSNVDVGTPIDFNLESGFFMDPLPFDVQFYLRTAIDDNVTRLGGRYVGDPDPLLCEKAFPRVRLNANYGRGPRPLVASEQRREVAIGSWTASPKRDNPDQVLLNVATALLPNRYYCFEFTRVRKPKVDPQEFRRDLTARIDLALREAETVIGADVLSDQDYRALREAVIGAVESQLAPGERVVVPSDSFLNELVETRDLPAVSRRSFDDVLDAQDKRTHAIANLEGATQAVVGLFEELALNADVEQLRQSARTPGSEEVAAVFEGKKDSLLWAELAGVDPAQRTRALIAITQGTQSMAAAVSELIGADPPADAVTAVPLAEAWTVQDLEVRKVNLQRTMRSINELKGIVLELRDGESIEQTGVTSDLSVLKETLQGIKPFVDFLIEGIDDVSEAIENRLGQVAELVADLDREEVERLRVEGSTLADFTVRANWYLGLDLGVAWSPDVEDFFAYVGTNVYFRPVNKKAPLRWSDFRRGQRRSELFKRLSLTIGIPINELVTPDDQFQSLPLERELQLVADRPVLFAAGFRLSDFFRVSVGSLVFKDRSPDPLVERDELAWSPLISLSIDWDVWGTLRNRFRQQPAAP